MARESFRLRAGFALAALLAAGPLLATDYVQAPGSALTFATKYQGEVFTGTLPGFVTRLRFDPARLVEARLDVTIPLAGVSIDNPDGTETLKSADFFNVARFPQARFESTRFRSLGGARYAADGTLTLRGASRPVTLEFTWTPGARPQLAGRATVKRLDFGVGGGDWADTALIPNEVAVSTRVLLVPAKK
ncbi:MAG TPA: YceI family protein [Lysobacter sp.]